ncbi:uncharacterized protein LOC133849375 [Drosophila sulfurigaster albostrigata]|uniref:uncharacterized protein LOC133849375 n=1 Tax=Drosophila sulfurigaster albostrigata TaxID=89887 RepID=UPI002D21C389|nr:uncharacterized protein LOC133849375 [Drosophila sulfurigaster albostrigata]
MFKNMKILEYCHKYCQDIKAMETSDNLFDLRQNIKTDVQELDEYLGGGIAIGRVTEFVGLSGTGKTQMCLQLSLNVQIPKQFGGLEGKALYIDTRGDFNPARLQELAIDLEKRFLHKALGFKSSTMMKNVYYQNCPSSAELFACIVNLNRYLNSNPCIKLILVDSLAFSIRMLENVRDRTNLLMELHALIHQVICHHNVAVVLTNELGFYRSRRKWKLRSTLGEKHTHLINERIWLTENGNYVGKTLKFRKFVTSINANCG